MRLKSLLFLVVAYVVIVASSCSKDDKDDLKVDNNIPNNVQAVVLDCNHFSQNRTLVKIENAKVDYIIECVMPISDADIVVEPGVVIEFKEDAGINLTGSGSFKAVGTTDKPIVFTGINKNAGGWRGLLIRSPSTKNEISHCEINFAGGKSFNSNGDLGAVIIWTDAKLKMTYTKINHSAAHALNVSYGGATLTLNNNIYKNNALAAVMIDPEYIGEMDGASDFTGNNNQDFVWVKLYTRGFAKNITISKINVPYRVLMRGGVTKYIDVSANVIVEPGVVFEFEGAGIKISETGSFKAVGTASDSIKFTGVSKVAGAWIGFDFRHTTSPLNEIAYANIEFAGNPLQEGAISMWAQPVLKVRNTSISNIANCAFFTATGTVQNPNLTFSDLNFVNIAGGNFCLK